jgi:hypothetical protein
VACVILYVALRSDPSEKTLSPPLSLRTLGQVVKEAVGSAEDDVAALDGHAQRLCVLRGRLKEVRVVWCPAQLERPVEPAELHEEEKKEEDGGGWGATKGLP